MCSFFRNKRSHKSHPPATDHCNRLPMEVEAHEPVQSKIGVLRSACRLVHLAVQRHHQGHRVLGDGVRAFRIRFDSSFRRCGGQRPEHRGHFPHLFFRFVTRRHQPAGAKGGAGHGNEMGGRDTMLVTNWEGESIFCANPNLVERRWIRKQDALRCLCPNTAKQSAVLGCH